MCHAFYKYFLITSTSFMASSGLYFIILTRWLWPLPIHDYSDYDWRLVPQCIGAICLLFFSVGLLIVLRERDKEIFYFTILLFLPLFAIVVLVIVQMINKRELTFNLSDGFLLAVNLLFIAILVNLFLLRQSIIRRSVRQAITQRQRYKKSRDKLEVDL